MLCTNRLIPCIGYAINTVYYRLNGVNWLGKYNNFERVYPVVYSCGS